MDFRFNNFRNISVRGIQLLVFPNKSEGMNGPKIFSIWKKNMNHLNLSLIFFSLSLLLFLLLLILVVVIVVVVFVVVVVIDAVVVVVVAAAAVVVVVVFVVVLMITMKLLLLMLLSMLLLFMLLLGNYTSDWHWWDTGTDNFSCLKELQSPKTATYL